MALTKAQVRTLQVLQEYRKITPEVVEQLISLETDLSTEGFENLLTETHKITAWDLLIVRSRILGMHICNVQRLKVHSKTYELLPEEDCKRLKVLPIGFIANHLLVATGGESAHIDLIPEIERIAKKSVVIFLARGKDIAEKLKGAPVQSDGLSSVEKDLNEFGLGTAEVEDATEEDAKADTGPIPNMANAIIEEAYLKGASDIHFDPQEKDLVIRYRIDGVLQEVLRLPTKIGPALVARMKIMCDLDIAERRLPQDGRIVFKKYTKRGFDLDLRVSTAPLNFGEGIVMRILDKQKTTLPMTALGFSEENLAKYRDCIRQPYGMILHCGPTGSGKSMTLYSALNEINTPDICIRTAEDPIEYTLPGLLQMQMHKQIGLTFASALRAFLRQDPDIILVGEIRDTETAGIAIEAALTGHLLISTLHTNDAPSTVARLTDMNIEPFMISASLVCVCAQRLLRRVCKNCRQPHTPEGNEKEIIERALGWSGPVFQANPKGCPKCGGSGYKGRVGIHELMTNNQELIEAINKEAETAELKRIAMRNGMKTLHQDSLLKVKQGLTTMAEALSNVPPDLELLSS